MAKSFAYCFVSISPVRAEARDQAEIETQLFFGEIVRVHAINAPWAKIETLTDSYSGFIDSKHIRMLSEKEVKRWNDGLDFVTNRERLLQTPWGNQWICRGSFCPAQNNINSFNIGKDNFYWLEKTTELPNLIIDLAKEYLNTPYLWGGKSPFGIDCSGLTQVIYRFYGINLPRNASDQATGGMKVELTELQANDLAFFHNNKGKITHVGIADGLGGIIHASGYVRYDDLTMEGIINRETKELTHRLNCIKRY